MKMSDIHNIHEGVVDPESEDPKNPEIQIAGFGKMSLKNAEKNIMGKLEDFIKLAEKIKSGNGTPADWKKLHQYWSHGAAHAILDTIDKAYTEIGKWSKQTDKAMQKTTESMETQYAINLVDKDGEMVGGFSVAAKTPTEAKRIAKQKISRGQRIGSVEIDHSLSTDLEKVRDRLIKYVNNHQLMKAVPSIKKGFIRQLERATSVKKLRAIQQKIDAQLKPKVDTK